MADDSKIRYSDLIEPDNSIDILIEKLEGINKAFGTVSSSVKDTAIKLANSLRNIDASSTGSKESLLNAANAAEKLLNTMEMLAFSVSDVGKLQAYLKQQINQTNKASAEQIKIANMAAGSYDKIKANLDETVSLYKSLSSAERESQFGKDVLSDIKQLSSELTHINAQIKSAFSSDDVNNVASSAAGSINALKEQLSELRKEYAGIDEITRKSSKGQNMASQIASLKAELNQLTQAEKNAIRVAELEQRIRESQIGSYNQLSAQYELNKIKLNEMSAAEREASDAGQRLEKDTFNIYQSMKKMQLATGSAKLNVGNYTQVWDGLSYSVSQVVREIPAAAVSLNTFFLAISNNIPMVIDEIKKVRAENEVAMRSGGKTTSVIGKITKALFSWQTALILVLAALSKYGADILAFFSQIFKGGHVIESTTKQLKNLNKELRQQFNDAAKNIATLRSLSKEWQSLQTVAEKQHFIKDHKSDFDNLNVSINNVADAERVFVKQTEAVVKSIMLRAKATAAFNLAVKSYEKSLTAENKNQQRAEYIKDWTKGASSSSAGQRIKSQIALPLVAVKGALNSFTEGQSEEYMKNAQNYIDMYADFTKQAKDILKEAGIEEHHKDTKDKRFNIDDYINNTTLKLQKLSNDLAEAAIQDDLVKQQTKIINDYEETQTQLLNIVDKNTRLLKEKSKQMTSEQIKALTDMNAQILEGDNSIMLQNQKAYAKNIEMLNNKIRIAELEQLDKESSLRIEAMRDNSEAEFTERKKLIKINMEKEIAVNNSLVDREKVDEQLIREKYNRKLEELELEHAKTMRNIRKGSNDMIIATTTQTDQRNVDARVDNVNIEYSNAIDANRMLDKGSQMSEAAIAEIYKRKIYDIYAKYYEDILQLTQNANKAEFNEIKHSALQIQVFELQQERERWQQKLNLSKSGLKQLTDEEIREAKSNIIKIDREIKETVADMFKEGISIGILQLLGFDDDSISALDDAKQQIIDSLYEILQVETEIAEREVELQQRKTDAAQAAYEAEITARANGYANNVTMAKRELQLQKSTLAKKQAQAEKYHRAQLVLDSLQQASSLITATANIWSSLTSLGIPGIILAAISTAGMFAAFIAAKIKAAELTSVYGEGGLEFLQGGSHASGNDIDLGIHNSRGRKMRAEGGEAVAIINKSKTRKYKKILPQLVDSLNSGSFEEKFMQPQLQLNKLHTKLVLSNNNNKQSDLTRIEAGINKLIEQNNTNIVHLADRTIVTKGNTTKTIYR